MSSADLSDEDWEFDEPKQSHKKKRNPPAEPRKLMRWNREHPVSSLHYIRKY